MGKYFLFFFNFVANIWTEYLGGQVVMGRDQCDQMLT